MSLQDQHDTLAAGIAAILAEQKRTDELLTGIRDALHLDDREQAKSFLKRSFRANGKTEFVFDSVGFFADYHARHGSEATLAPDPDVPDSAE